MTAVAAVGKRGKAMAVVEGRRGTAMVGTMAVVEAEEERRDPGTMAAAVVGRQGEGTSRRNACFPLQRWPFALWLFLPCCEKDEDVAQDNFKTMEKGRLVAL
ncbi:hypothetical protein ACA910_015347 [Epithemia clementina (nom. ined.)]